MTLNDRRRALMGVTKNKILWEWNPSDGIEPISVTTNKGSPSYTLLSDSLQINLPADTSVTTYIVNNTPIIAPQKYMVSCYYKNLPSEENAIGIQLAVTSRFDNNINANSIIQIYTSIGAKRISIGGTFFPLNTIPSTGKLSMLYDKTNNTVYAYLNDVMVGSNTYTPASSTQCIVWTNSSVAASINVSRIVIEEVQ